MTEAVENLQESSDNSQTIIENTEEFPTESVEKRSRGRPKGSRDSAPRKRRIIEEPIVQEAPPPSVPPPPTQPEIVAPSEPVRVKTRRVYTPRAPTPAPPYNPEPAPLPPASPPSPRTLFRQAGETIYHLQTQRENARRDYWTQQIEKSLKVR